ncbi:MAG: hypothetical protein WBS54_12345 [Acidobacteriota bacterium]
MARLDIFSRWLLAALLATLVSMALGAQGVPLGAPYEPFRQGRIVAIHEVHGRITATVKLEEATPGTPGVGVTPMPVEPGMTVRLAFSLGTGLFNMPIGQVRSLPDSKGELLVKVRPKLLERTVQNPQNQNLQPIREFFRVGAQVTITRETLP